MRSASKVGHVLLPIVFTAAAVIGIFSLVLLVRDFTMQPRAVTAYPDADEVGVEPNTAIRLTFNKAMSPGSLLPATFLLRDEHGSVIPSTVTYDDAARTATLQPAAVLEGGSTYELMLKGGAQGVLDRHNRPVPQDKTWRFTVGIAAAGTPADGPGGPILLITSSTDGFSRYYAEILRNEGLNEFDVKELAQVSAFELAKYDVALLGEMPLDDGHVRLLTDWVQGGGNLVAMRPARNLAQGLGFVSSISATDGLPQHGGYLKISAKTPAGAGLIQQPIQFHGDADRFNAASATVLATLYQDGNTATSYPAISFLQIGAGTAIVFSYDLAKSIVYTRQGNPEWSGMERDGIPPVRSDDLFYGASEKDPQPDWVDPQLVAIPQADIQQRLLANLILTANAGKKPLPRFWYLPRGLKAVIVMTGDDHGHGGTTRRFRSYQRRSTKGCSLEHWECIRATSNIFVGSISSADAADLARQGFEIDLHVYTACTDWPTKEVKNAAGAEQRVVDREFEDTLYTQQLEGFAIKYPALPAPVGNRTDCIAWGDYDTQPEVELNHNIRLDTNYYYWPAKWVKDKPGLFTGSGMPMRFARRDGTVIDVYQVPTQMTDESNQRYPFTVDTLLANALGSLEYFGVFTANMHNDDPKSHGANAILASARKHRIPVITTAQLLQWLDGRNASQFRDLKWQDNVLSFSIQVGAGGNGIEAMLPIHSASADLASISRDGTPVPWQKRTVAGLSYAVIPGAVGTFRASYSPRR